MAAKWDNHRWESFLEGETMARCILFSCLILGLFTVEFAHGQTRAPAAKGAASKASIGGKVAPYTGAINDGHKLHPLAESGANWLLKTQQADGGWAPVRFGLLGPAKDGAAKSDYSTSAMAGLALVRAGASPNEGTAKPALRKAIEFVAAEAVANQGLAESKGIVIDLAAGSAVLASQPSYKLGPMAGPSHATQFLARVLPMLTPDDPLRKPVETTLKVTVKRLEQADHAFLRSFGKDVDGSYRTTPPVAKLAAAASFSPTHHVLICLTALETAQAAGVEVDTKVLQELRRKLVELVDARTGRIDLQKVLSIELYSFSSAMRSSAVGARGAKDLCGPQLARLKDKALIALLTKRCGDPELAASLATDVAAQQVLANRLIAGDAGLMTGFGTPGGEEFLSYLLMSEAFVLGGNPRVYQTWKTGLADRLGRLQNADGSWTGMHCITDPVYMTAAAVLSLSAERDEPLLVHMAQQIAADAEPKSASER